MSDIEYTDAKGSKKIDSYEMTDYDYKKQVLELLKEISAKL